MIDKRSKSPSLSDFLRDKSAAGREAVRSDPTHFEAPTLHDEPEDDISPDDPDAEVVDEGDLKRSWVVSTDR